VTRAAPLAALALALVGCKPPEWAKVGATPLVQADGLEAAPAGATLEVTPATVGGITPPGEAIVRLGVAREVAWKDVEQLVATIEGSGKRAVMLVGRRDELGAIALRDPIGEAYVSVLAFAGGKACVRGPGQEAAKCVHSPDHPWVEKSFVRQLVREAREAFEVSDVAVEVDPALGWGDVVNALDGARTCCGERPVRAAVRTMVDDGTVLVPVE
jgi:hypothetical protein